MKVATVVQVIEAGAAIVDTLTDAGQNDITIVYHFEPDEAKQHSVSVTWSDGTDPEIVGLIKEMFDSEIQQYADEEQISVISNVEQGTLTLIVQFNVA